MVNIRLALTPSTRTTSTEGSFRPRDGAADRSDRDSARARDDDLGAPAEPQTRPALGHRRRIFMASNNKIRVGIVRSEEHTSELQSRQYLVCRLLLEKKKTIKKDVNISKKKSNIINNYLTIHSYI